MIALVGDNSSVLNEQERDAHFGGTGRSILAERAIQKASKEREKQILASAKTDGLNIKELEMFLKVMADGDRILDKHTLTESALKRAGILSGKPAKDLLDRVDQEELISAQGRAAGLLGADCISGYDAGSSDDKIWISGWKEGQRVVLEEWASANAKLLRRRGVAEELPDDPFPGEL